MDVEFSNCNKDKEKREYEYLYFCYNTHLLYFGILSSICPRLLNYELWFNHG